MNKGIKRPLICCPHDEKILEMFVDETGFRMYRCTCGYQWLLHSPGLYDNSSTSVSKLNVKFNVKLLSRKMQERGLSKRDLSKIIGASQQSIRTLVTGLNQPYASTISKIATALDCSMDCFYLIDEDETDEEIESKIPGTRMRAELTDERIKKIADSYNSGKNSTEVAKEFNCGTNTVIKCARELGYKIKKQGGNGLLTDEVRLKAVKEYKESDDKQAVADKYGINITTLRNYHFRQEGTNG